MYSVIRKHGVGVGDGVDTYSSKTGEFLQRAAMLALQALY